MLIVLTEVLRLIGFALGASLHIFLIAVLVRKRHAALAERLVLATLFASGLWHGANAVGLFLLAEFGVENVALLNEAATAGLALAPSFLLHLGLVWANLKVRNWLAASGYLAAPVMWWMLEAGSPRVYSAWVCVSLAATAALCLYAAPRRSEDHERRFFRLFAWTLLAVLAAGALTRPGSAALVLTSIAPPVCFSYFVYRYNFLGLLIGRRVVFALTLGVVVALYLFLVSRVAVFLADAYEGLEFLTQAALILAVSLVWLPLYGWMSRFLSKRTQLYVDFGKHLIEEAARILDLERKLQFLAEEVGRTFALRKVLLRTAGEPALRGEFGACTDGGHAGVFDEIKELVVVRRTDFVNVGRPGEPELHRLIAGLGFNYLFPLWYEGDLEGLLLLDTSPRLFLDENEPILLGLSRQISHSIETCRVIEEKIHLERALARQEHLVSLGKVAATIAHEIKNPLSSVKTLAQLMREDPEVRQKYDRDLGYMIGETDRLNRSVQQLLSFSRPAPEQRQEVDLTELLETMAQLLSRQYASEQIQVQKSIAPGVRLKHGNAEIITQIILNLALNALQASEPGGEVCLGAGAQSEGKIFVSVSDHGPGIPQEVRQKIFEPFFTTKQRGTGLGLAIVRKNVRHLGGEISIESPILEGRGTRVVVTLPAE